MERGPSLQGRGARFEKKMPGGRWTHENGVVHINILELLAIFFSALKSLFKKFSQNIDVLKLTIQ